MPCHLALLQYKMVHILFSAGPKTLHKIFRAQARKFTRTVHRHRPSKEPQHQWHLEPLPLELVHIMFSAGPKTPLFRLTKPCRTKDKKCMRRVSKNRWQIVVNKSKPVRIIFSAGWLKRPVKWKRACNRWLTRLRISSNLKNRQISCLQKTHRSNNKQIQWTYWWVVINQW